MGRLVDLDGASLEERRIGALPIVNAFVERLGVQGLLDDYVVADPRASLAPSASLLVLLRSLVVERAPVYKIAEWVAGRPEALLGLHPGQIAALNDDRAGRALDALFDADRASMLTALMTKAIETFALSLDELHNDATTLHMQGEYSSAAGDSPRAPRVRFGHAKERPRPHRLRRAIASAGSARRPRRQTTRQSAAGRSRRHGSASKSCARSSLDPGVV